MYQIGKYNFTGYKHIPGHRANYAILSNTENRTLGMKYSPSYCYTSEYDVLDKLSHPQIPKRCDIGNDILYEKENYVFKMNFIVLQHYEGEDVIDYCKKKKLPDYTKINKIVCYFSTITDPLEYLHSKGYVHADIKPGHLILNPHTGIISLIDLELTIKTGEALKGMTIEYSSPEQKQMINLLNNLTDKKDEELVLKQVKIDGRSDLYSIGLLMYEILTNKLWIYTKVPPANINNRIPQRLNEIILGLLEESPLNRISSAEILKNELLNI